MGARGGVWWGKGRAGNGGGGTQVGTVGTSGHLGHQQSPGKFGKRGITWEDGGGKGVRAMEHCSG